MKKLVIILLIVLDTIGVFAQKGKPCVDEYKQDRTLSEMREILMRDGPYYDNLRIAYAEAINYNIGQMVIYSSKKGITDLFENTILMEDTFFEPKDFQNGVRYGNTVRFTNIAGQYSKYYAAMHYCGKDYIYAKVACINPQKATIRGIFTEEKKEEAVAVSKKQTESESTGDHNVIDNGKPKPSLGNLNPNTPAKERKVIKIKVGDVIITVAIVAIVVEVIKLLLPHKNAQIITDNGNPGGAPVTRPVVVPPVVTPPVVIPVEGPGGAPTTK